VSASSDVVASSALVEVQFLSQYWLALTLCPTGVWEVAHCGASAHLLKEVMVQSLCDTVLLWCVV